MITRNSARSAACFVTLALIGIVVAASVQTNSVSAPFTAASAAQMDISALATGVKPDKLPLLSVKEPI
jgi:hypothetical protein